MGWIETLNDKVAKSVVGYRFRLDGSGHVSFCHRVGFTIASSPICEIENVLIGMSQALTVTHRVI